MRQTVALLITVLAVGGCIKRTAINGPIDMPSPAFEPMYTQTASPRPPVSGPVSSGGKVQQVALFPGVSPLSNRTGKAAILRAGSASLDLEDADIQTATKAVLGDVLKVSFSIDPRVQGRVTLKTQGRVPAQQAVTMFEEALLQNGAALIDKNGVFAVIPATEAATTNTFSIQGGAGVGAQAGYSVRAVQLRHISAKEMAEILSPLAKDAVVRIDADRNVIVLQGTGAQFNALMETVRTFDVDWLANKSVGVFRLNAMPASEMNKSLTQLLQNENVDATMARFIVLDANNAIIAVAKSPQILASIRRWVQRLDQAGGSDLRLFTYEMRHARAADVAPLVAGALGIQSVVAGREGATGRTGAGSSGGTFSNVRGGQGSGGLRNQNPVAPPPGFQDPSGPAMGNGAGPPGLSPGRAMLDQGRREGAGDQGPVARIVADDSSNKLLVYASASQFERVKDVMRTIDIPQKQVLVEATIIEVTLNNDLRYGAQFYLDKVVNGTKITGSLTPGSTGGLGTQIPGGSLTIGMSNKAILDALSGVTRVNVISSPNIMVMNNQPARLVVGDQVPVTTQTRSDPLSTSNVQVSSVEYRDTGIIFDVTPRVNSSGTVTLDILQEVSNVKRNSAQATIQNPTISQRRVTSTVVAGNNETIVIGGLFSSDRQGTRAGLPFLTSVPLLGGIFGTTTNSDVKTELLVLISPRIVNDKNDARRVTRELQDRVTDLRLIETSPRRPATRNPAPPPCKAPGCISAKY